MDYGEVWLLELVVKKLLEIYKVSSLVSSHHWYYEFYHVT